MGEVVVEGGVAPYAVDWGGYNPDALGAGTYAIQVTDANLCQANLSVLVSQPAPFEVALTSTTPLCTDPFSGTLTPIFTGGSEPISLDWGGVTRMRRRQASNAGGHGQRRLHRLANVEVLEADIPDPLVLNGKRCGARRQRGVLLRIHVGKRLRWTYTGAQAQQVFNSFAISLQWDSLGMQQVCVTETNEDGCVGPEVCLDVWVEDDVAEVAPCLCPRRCWPTPTLSKRRSWCMRACKAGKRCKVWNSVGAVMQTSIWEGSQFQSLDVTSLPAGLHMLQVSAATTPFIAK